MSSSSHEQCQTLASRPRARGGVHRWRYFPVAARVIWVLVLTTMGWPVGDARAADAPGAGPAGVRISEFHPGNDGKPGLSLLAPELTGVRFTNVLRGDLSLTNAVAHNGSGLALGDVDGDGRPDIYLCALQGPNRLYRNVGNWRFEEMDLGEAACPGQLSTGAVLADVDGDGDLDLLVNGIVAGTRLYLNDGRGHWTEVKNSGLSRTATAMSLALADIDGDGDLDLYCTHYIDTLSLADPTTQLTMGWQDGRPVVARVNGQPANQPPWKDRYEVLAGGDVRELGEVDGLYRNDGQGHFTPIQFEPGVYQTEDGKPLPPPRDLGLGIMFRDVNDDGAPDFYVCNDNGMPDRFWINTGKGAFKAIPATALRQGSHSSMGVDFADVDRNGRDDFLVLDMLARDRSQRLRHPAGSDVNLGIREDPGARPIIKRNTLFLGREDLTYAETGLQAGVAATDWSWCPVFLDVDLDGYEDLLITNGFEQDVLDQDSTDSIRLRKWTPEQMKRYRQIHPRWDSENASFRNRGDGTFEPMGARWGFDRRGVSHGMALADLDNDGDLDVVVNNLNGLASVYRNEASAPRIAIRLKGMSPNTQGIGARFKLTGGGLTQSQEQISGGRYLSGDQAMRVFAVPPGSKGPFSLEIRWRSGRTTTIPGLEGNRGYEIEESAAAPTGPVLAAPVLRPYFTNVSDRLNQTHVEADFDDWAEQPLLPHRLSRLGPGIAWYDFDGDGWEDLLVTAGRGGKLAVLANQEGKAFKLLEGADRATGDQGGVVGWADGKGNQNFLVAMANGERERAGGFESRLIVYSPVAAPRALAAGKSSIGPLAVADVDGDGDLDVFVGGRYLPGRYPEPASSALWRNQAGELQLDATLSAPFQSIGMVSGATFCDLDNDGRVDLVLALEWGSLRVFRNLGGRFEDVTGKWGFAAHRGLWTGVTAGDFNADGRIDLVAGNWGRNSVYELNPAGTNSLFYGDWTGGGTVQMVEAWSGGGEGEWWPTRDRNWLGRGFPDLAQRFPTHRGFAAATVRDVLGTNYSSARRLEATVLESSVFLNRGSDFERIALPPVAQRAPIMGVSVGDFNGDGKQDLFVSHNFFGTVDPLSRDAAGFGLWLRGQGNGTFVAVEPQVSGIRLTGEQRGAALGDFNHDGRIDLAVTQNQGPTQLFLNQLGEPGLRVFIQGPPQNPNAIGAQLRVRYDNRPSGPVHSIQAGSGYWSQDSPFQVLGMTRRPTAVWIRWPGGREQTLPIDRETRELQVNY